MDRKVHSNQLCLHASQVLITSPSPNFLDLHDLYSALTFAWNISFKTRIYYLSSSLHITRFGVVAAKKRKHFE